MRSFQCLISIFRLRVKTILAICMGIALVAWGASCTIKDQKGSIGGFNAGTYEIISNKCFSCHSGGNFQGDLGVMDDANALISMGYVIPGSPSTSLLYLKLTNPTFGARMPYGGPYLSDGETNVIKDWIVSLGANTSTCIPNIIAGSPSFNTDVRPLLETALPQNVGTSGTACISCHHNASTRARFTLDNSTVTWATMVSPTLGLSPYVGPLIVAGDPCNSRLYTRLSQTTGPDSPWNQMPRGAANPIKMTSAQLGIIYTWILNGAPNN